MKSSKQLDNWKKPKTIADLKINWTFELWYIDAGVLNFESKNKELIRYKIKPDNYHFLIDDWAFMFNWNSYYGVNQGSVSIASFIEAVTWKMRTVTRKTNLKLDYFELVSENTFRIHTTLLD